ncbi:hypothetical protein [Cupriavidus pauculus]|uniref:8-oxoguanine DNA glycosylase n=1 Tax=Cupriavidus pauculus TaxID=82633 RepID=UPI001FD4044C|nr:hypothetical protein [Cupriavidus pauculus]
MQVAEYLHNDDFLRFELPSPESELMPGVKWGRHEALFSPAYWKTQTEIHGSSCTREGYRLGRTLIEETAACLLGGHGLPAEIGLAAFRRLQDVGILEDDSADEADYASLLSAPLQMSGGRSAKYRFAKTKAKYLASVHAAFRASVAPSDDVQLRRWLLDIDGIGPKTASWVVRNWLSSDNVAILDIHIYRAGLFAGIFDDRQSVDRHYFEMEERFLEFARALEVSAAMLDAVMWVQMRSATRTVC